MARMHLNYSEADFRSATFKDIADLMQIHLEENQQQHEETSNNEYVEQKVNITDIPFL